MFRYCGLIVSFFLFLFSGIVHAASVDKVIAIVNDDVITQIELDNRLRGLRAEIQARGATAPAEEVLRKQMIERMINDRIQLQAADRLGIGVSEPELDGAVMSVAQSNNMTLRQLREALTQQGIPYSLFRESVRTDMVINQIFIRRIRNSVIITDEELDSFIDRGGGKADAREYDVSHILIRVPETATASEVDQTRLKAEEAKSRLDQGMDFREAAATYSDAPDALEGGELGWREPRQLPELFTEALGRIDEGQSTDILQSANGFHILHINDARGANVTSVKQTSVRHILMRTDEFLSETEAKFRLEQLRERILNGENFAELARIHSDDTLSAAKGGELGWVSPGELVNTFEEEMGRLKPGEISHPIQSSFGFHIIEVLDRRQQNMGAEATRARARTQLVAQKSDERYEQWLRRLRDESFIEILEQ